MLKARRGWVMLAWVIASQICMADPVTKRVCHVSIKVQPLPSAVADVVRQCPVEIVYVMKILRGTAPEFSCRSCTVSEVFAKLLANSGVHADSPS